MRKVKAVIWILFLIGALSLNSQVAAQSFGKPSWLKPGMRLTYYAAAASVPGSFASLVPDPDGRYRDPVTGQMLSEQAIPGASGHGYTEVTLAALDDQTAVLDIRSLGLNPANNNSRSLLTYSAKVAAPDDAEFWKHPGRLAELRNNPAAGIAIYRMRYPMNGRTFNAVRINTKAASVVYDTDSGLLLFSSSVSVGASVWVLNGGASAGLGAGSTLLTQSRLLDVRQPAFPWTTAPPPTWFAQLHAIDLQGRVTIEVLSAGTVTLPIAGRIDLRGGGENWRSYRITTRITQTGGLPQIPTALDRASGPGSLGALGVDPQSLARLAPGRLLDDDRTTGMRTTVASADSQTVVIAEQGSGLSIAYEYDVRTGRLVRAQVVTTLPTGRETVEYRLVNPR